jgi:hypothetical protein
MSFGREDRAAAPNCFWCYGGMKKKKEKRRGERSKKR